jgi:hypothetical protein
VYIEQFFIRASFEGFLEGAARSISKEVLKRLPGDIAKVFWDCSATLILEPDQEILPAFTFIAHLESSDCVPDQEPGDYSRLLVAWFDDDIDAPPVQLAQRALRDIDWDQHAENWID